MKQNIIYEAFHDKTDTIKFFKSEHYDTHAHFHRCIEMLYVIDGAIECTVNEQKFCAKKDELIFVHKCGARAQSGTRLFQLCIDYRAALFRRFSRDISDGDFARTPR